MKGGDAGALGLPIFLTDEDIELIMRAYLLDPPQPYQKVFPHPMDPRGKVRLSVPGHPDLKQRCLRAELMFLGMVRDWSCFNQGFLDPVAILSIPGEVRVMVQLDVSKVRMTLPQLPIPNYG